MNKEYYENEDNFFGQIITFFKDYVRTCTCVDHIFRLSKRQIEAEKSDQGTVKTTLNKWGRTNPTVFGKKHFCRAR